MSFLDKYFWTFMAGFVLLIVILIPASVKRTDDRAAKCESLGGLYLENSQIVGKVVYYNYFCVRKDAVIGVE